MAVVTAASSSGGLAAAAIHGARWIDDDVPVELIYRNARAPSGVIVRDERLFDEEVQQRAS